MQNTKMSLIWLCITIKWVVRNFYNARQNKYFAIFILNIFSVRWEYVLINLVQAFQAVKLKIDLSAKIFKHFLPSIAK